MQLVRADIVEVSAGGGGFSGLFYVCSQQGDVRHTHKEQKEIYVLVCYTNLATRLWTIHIAIEVITSVLYKIRYTWILFHFLNKVPQ